MLFFVRYKDKEHRVRVESRQGQLFVKVNDGSEKQIDLLYHGHNCTYINDSRVFFANVVGEKNIYTVGRPDGNLPLTVESEYRRIVTMLRGQQFEDETHVYAKMPGKIVRVLVKQGQKVEKGQSVVVMEAMKMENEVRAMRESKVSKVCVKEGQAVETGELLLELE